MNIFHFAWRETIGRPGRTLLNAFGVAIGLALILLLFGISESYKEAVTFPFTQAEIDFTITRPNQSSSISAPSGAILPNATQAIFGKELENVAQIFNVSGTMAVLQLWSFDPGAFKVVLGIDPASLSIGPAKALEWVKDGRAIRSGERDVAMLESHYARFFGLKTGDSINISGKKFLIVGTFAVKEGVQLTSANVYIPLPDAQVLAGVGTDTFNTIYLKLEDPNHWKQTTEAIREIFPDFFVTTMDSVLVMSDSILVLMNRLMIPAAILVIAICVLFVYRSLASSVWEKIGEIGTQKALGWSRRNVAAALALELFMQNLFGAVLGLCLGAVGTWLTSGWEVQLPQIGGTAPPLPGVVQNVEMAYLPVSFNIYFYAVSFFVTMIIGFLMSLILVNKVTNIKPTEAWRSL